MLDLQRRSKMPTTSDDWKTYLVYVGDHELYTLRVKALSAEEACDSARRYYDMWGSPATALWDNDNGTPEMVMA